MPKLSIKRSKVIKAPKEKVHQIVSDMGSWSTWSPWLIMDPDAKVEVSADHKYYEWEGGRVGTGNMQVTKEDGDSVDYDLNFLKPWNSKAKVKMETKEIDGGTEVTWHMDSSLPFFMFWMKKSMEAYVGNDYERGLNLLKDYVEDGEIHSKLNFKGQESFKGCTYVAIKRSCFMSESGKIMEADFNRLMQMAMARDNFEPHHAFTIYHNWDMVKGRVEYTAGVPYNGDPGQLEADMTLGSMPDMKVYTLEHVGPYEHLGNAWSTLVTMQRNKEFKLDKKIHPFETYGNSPKDTGPKDLISRIHFAVK
jgi:effector-binding domain-containing protein